MRRRRRIGSLLDRLEGLAPALDRIETSPEVAETVERIERSLAAGAVRVFILGGDGSAGDAARALAGSDVPLGLIPTGTTNVVARELGLPANPFRAVDALARSTATRAFSTWEVAERTLLLGASVGFDAEIMRDVGPAWKARLGPPAIAWTGLKTMGRHRFPSLRITGADEEGGSVELQGVWVIASNTMRYAERRIVLPAADPEDDLLDVMVGTRPSRRALCGFWLRLFAGGGRQLRQRGMRYVRLRHLSVTTESAEPAEAQVNGDAVGRVPFEATPSGRVRLLVPEDGP